MKYFFLFVLLSFTLAAKGQGQMATLFHQGEIRTFQGIEALVKANDAAEDGDVISLSAGNFTACKIVKCITLRGAGTDYLGLNRDKISNLTGTLTIQADKRESGFIMEGITVQDNMDMQGVYGAQFIKCDFNSISSQSNLGSFDNLTFLHCRIMEFPHQYNMSMTAISCYINNPSFGGNNSTYEAYNCILNIKEYNDITRALLRNCIILNAGNLTQTYSSQPIVYSNNLFVGSDDMVCTKFERFAKNGNKVISSDVPLFKAGSFYQLTEEAEKFTGSDGTQPGIYGGNLPFNDRPSYIRLENVRVAPETDKEGKLAIDLEIIR